MKRINLMILTLMMLIISVSICSAKTIKGIVTNKIGKSIPNANLTLIESRENNSGKIIGKGISGNDGRFKIDYQSGELSIYNKLTHIIATGDKKIGFLTIINADADQKITLCDTGSITGIIKGFDGAPIQGAVIRPSVFVTSGFLGMSIIDSRNISPAVSIPNAVSDARGIFTIEGLPMDWEAHLTAYINDFPINKPEKFAGQWSDSIPAYPEAGNPSKPIRVTFIADTTPIKFGGIKGKLYDVSEKPISGATVTAIKTKGNEIIENEKPINTVTNDAGEFEFPKLKTGEYSLSIFESIQPVPIEPEIRVSDGYISEVPLYAETGIPVSGKVTDMITGKPIMGAMVTSPYTKPVSTKTDGSFTVHMLPGEGILVANAYTAGYYPTGSEINVPASGRLDDVKIKLMAYKKIHGRITDTAGKPIGGAWIQTMREKSPGDLHQADAFGNYKIVADDDKNIILIASDQNMNFGSIIKVNLTGKDIKADMKLKKTSVIKGTVTDQNKNPVANARIIPLISIGNYRLTGMNSNTYTNENGSFILRNLISDAKYALRIRADGYEEALIDENAMPKLISGKTTIKKFEIKKSN